MKESVFLGGNRHRFRCSETNGIHSGMLVTDISAFDRPFLLADLVRIDARKGDIMEATMELGARATDLFFTFFQEQYIDENPSGHNCFSFVTKVTAAIDTFENPASSSQFGIGASVERQNLQPGYAYGILQETGGAHHAFLQAEDGMTLSSIGVNGALMYLTLRELEYVYGSAGIVPFMHKSGVHLNVFRERLTAP